MKKGGSSIGEEAKKVVGALIPLIEAIVDKKLRKREREHANEPDEPAAAVPAAEPVVKKRRAAATVYPPNEQCEGNVYKGEPCKGGAQANKMVKDGWKGHQVCHSCRDKGKRYLKKQQQQQQAE